MLRSLPSVERVLSNDDVRALETRFGRAGVTDAIRAVDLQPGDGDRAIASMRDQGAVLHEGALRAG